MYSFLNEHFDTFPKKIQYMLPYMTEYNWLVAYASVEGIALVLSGMNRRTKGISQMDLAIEDLKKHYKEFESDFTSFFKDLEQFSDEKTTFFLSK